MGLGSYIKTTIEGRNDHNSDEWEALLPERINIFKNEILDINKSNESIPNPGRGEYYNPDNSAKSTREVITVRD